MKVRAPERQKLFFCFVFSTACYLLLQFYLLHYGQNNAPHHSTPVRTWEDVVSACDAVTQQQQQAIFEMPFHVWTKLRFQAMRLAIGCNGSTFPLREGIRHFEASKTMSDQSQQARHLYTLSSLPLNLGSEHIIAQLDVERTCAMASLIAPLLGRNRNTHNTHNNTVKLDIQNMREALCPSQTYSLEKKKSQQIIDQAVIQFPVIGVVNPCKSFIHQSSSIWASLLDGKLPDNHKEDRKVTNRSIPCGVSVTPSAFVRAMRVNYKSLHNAPDLSTLHNPTELAQGTLRQVPPKAWDPNLPLINPNTAKLAAAMAANDTIKLRHLLMPESTSQHLPSVATFYNIMVSPFGLLQSLQKVLASPPVLSPKASRKRNCSQFLEEVFEEEPFGLRQWKEQSWTSHLERTLGGKDMVKSLKMRAPNIWYTNYWPIYTGIELTEWNPPNTLSYVFTALHTPNPKNNDKEAPHEACLEWDLQRDENQEIQLFDEVVVIPLDADSYYWFSVDMVGRLALMLPYLYANPHVKLHVPYYMLHGPWTKKSHHANEWLTRLKLFHRCVSGRIVAKVAHVLDRTPAGPHQHPLQLLGVRDMGLKLINQIPQPQQFKPDTVLLIKRSRTRAATNHDEVLAELKKAGLRVIIHNDEEPQHNATQQEMENNWLDGIRAWTQVGVVVAPHGAGLTNAALLAPGATLIETVPKGHAGAGLYYFHLAHYMRLHYHHLITPGTQLSNITLDSKAILWLVCGIVKCKTQKQQPPWPVLKPANETVVECLSSSNTTSINQELKKAKKKVVLDAFEPVFAMRPYLDFNLTYGNDIYSMWISTEDKLPLSKVKGIALLLGAARHPITFHAFEPTQRSLLRVLEAKEILPVHVPNSVTNGPHQDFNDSCTTNQDLHATIRFTMAIINAVRSARGLPDDVSHIPVFAIGLSSGGTFSGILASHMRLDGIVSQLDAPEAILPHIEGDLVHQNRECEGYLGKILPDSMMPGKIPPIWLSMPLFNSLDLSKMTNFSRTLIEKYHVPSTKIMTNLWVPKIMTPTSIHEAAPWLLSPAASRVIVDIIYSIGLLGNSPDVLHALETHQPICASKPMKIKPTKFAAATNQSFPRFFHNSVLKQWSGQSKSWVVVEHALQETLVFANRSRSPGRPMIFAHLEDPDFPQNCSKVIRPFTKLLGCRGEVGGIFKPQSEECLVSRNFPGWVWRVITESQGDHEFHESPWQEIVEWLLLQSSSSTKASPNKTEKIEKGSKTEKTEDTKSNTKTEKLEDKADKQKENNLNKASKTGETGKVNKSNKTEAKINKESKTGNSKDKPNKASKTLDIKTDKPDKIEKDSKADKTEKLS